MRSTAQNGADYSTLLGVRNDDRFDSGGPLKFISAVVTEISNMPKFVNVAQPSSPNTPRIYVIPDLLKYRSVG